MEKHSQEKPEPGRNSDVEKVGREKTREMEKVRREKMQVHEEGRKVAKHRVFSQCFVAPDGRKSRLAKAAGAEPAGQRRD